MRSGAVVRAAGVHSAFGGVGCGYRTWLVIAIDFGMAGAAGPDRSSSTTFLEQNRA